MSSNDKPNNGGKKAMMEEQQQVSGPRFELGRTVGTPGAVAALQGNGVAPAELLDRHHRGDWGELSEEDRQENELSVKEGFRILSSYRLPDGQKVYVITEADRSSTTILLAREY